MIPNQNLLQSLLPFFPFQSVINLGSPLITEYLARVKDCAPEFAISYEQTLDAFDQALAIGWSQTSRVFQDTTLLEFAPVFILKLKHFARQQLSDEQQKNIIRAYIDYQNWYGEQLYYMMMDTPVAERAENLAFLTLELENLRVALYSALEYCYFDFTSIHLPLSLYYDLTQQHQERLYLTHFIQKKLLEVNKINQNDHYDYSLVENYDSLGTVYLRLKQYEIAQQYYEAALKTYEVSNLPELFPHAIRGLYQNLAAVADYLHQYEKGDDYYEAMLEVVMREKDDEGLADYYLNRAKTLIVQGRSENAKSYFGQALDIYQKLGIPDAEVTVYHFLSDLMIKQKQFKEAEAYIEKGILLLNQLENQLRLASFYEDYCTMALTQRDYPKAVIYAKKALEVNLQSDNQYNIGISYLLLFISSFATGEIEESSQYLQTAEQYFQSIDNQTGLDLCDRIKTISHSNEDGNSSISLEQLLNSMTKSGDF